MITAQDISTIGFPIVAYLLLFLRLDRTVRKNTEAINRMIDMMGKK